MLRLENEGDDALRRNDATAARSAFTALLELKLPESSPVTEVNARLGLGDAGLADEDAEAATGDYEMALALATTAGYRFGRLRALVGLGYMTLQFHSAGVALRLFTDAVTLAGEVGDLAYEGSAQLGTAECQERRGDLEAAVRHAAEAYRISDGIGSALGRGNAAQRLGTMLHRLGRRDEARDWLEQAHPAFVEAKNPMGLTNALSGLGDLLLDSDDSDGAERAYREGLHVAETARLPRSRAHALQDLARVTLVRGDWAAAAGQFRTALAAYREIDDLLGMSNASDKLARCHARLGHADDALRVRMDAVLSVEQYRATHRDEFSQREYRNRFAATYAAALAAATTAGSADSFAVVTDCLAGRRLAGLFAETARAAAAPAGELALLQELLVRADQRLVCDRRARTAALRSRMPGTGSLGTADDDPQARRPVGELWLVPWSAVPVAGRRVLGEAADYVVCPSLTVQRQLAARGPARRGPAPHLADLWRSPFVRHHQLARFQADPAWLVSPLQSSAQARERLRDGSPAMVLTGHGRPAPGLGHYLELDQDEWLVPADLIGTRPPGRLAVIACWGGAIPGRGPTDPLSLATLALAAGSAEILATVGELADSEAASMYVEKILAGLAGGSASAALHAATRWVLRDDAMRAARIHHWAPLVPLGTHY